MSTHENFGREHEIRNSSDRSLGVVFSVFLSLIALSPLRKHQPVRVWALILGGLFLVVALVRPLWLAPLNRIWTKLGLIIGKVMNPIITSLLFFLAVVPTGLVLRLLGKDPLRLKFDEKVATYWIERSSSGAGPGSMSNQF